MLAEFLVHYEANIARGKQALSRRVAALETLAAAGATLAVCTNKREYLSSSCSPSLDFNTISIALPAATPSPWSKPDPGHLTRVIAQAGGVPSRAIMVGDSDVDLRTAKDAACRRSW